MACKKIHDFKTRFKVFNTSKDLTWSVFNCLVTIFWLTSIGVVCCMFLAKGHWHGSQLCFVSQVFQEEISCSHRPCMLQIRTGSASVPLRHGWYGAFVGRLSLVLGKKLRFWCHVLYTKMMSVVYFFMFVLCSFMAPPSTREECKSLWNNRF